MNIITFTPHADLQKLKVDWPEQYDRWKEALKTSRQAKYKLMREDGSMCCLGVACHMEGASEESMLLNSLPDVAFSSHEFAKAVAGIYFATAVAEGEVAFDFLIAQADLCETRSSVEFAAAQLNDNFLTHPQISQLLDGQTVTMEVSE